MLGYSPACWSVVVRSNCGKVEVGGLEGGRPLDRLIEVGGGGGGGRSGGASSGGPSSISSKVVSNLISFVVG